MPRRRTRSVLVCLFGTCLFACGDGSGPTGSGTPTLQYTHRYTHLGPRGLGSTADLGLWMFTRREHEPSAIANWLGRPYVDGRTLLEPTNVLWVDYAARTELDAQLNVWRFLHACGFQNGCVGHSGCGELPLPLYYTSYEENVWRSNLGITFDDVVKTLDDPIGITRKNNHGRVFPTFQGTSDGGTPAFFTLGAFSRETDFESGHDFVNFRVARNVLSHPTCRPVGWTYRGLEDFPNTVDDPGWTTADHNGTAVFERVGCAGFPPPAGESWSYRLVGTALGFTNITEDVNEKVGGRDVYRIREINDPPGLGEYIGCLPDHGEVELATDAWAIDDPSINERLFWEPPLHRCRYGTPTESPPCEWIGTFDGEFSREVTEVIAYETVSVPFGTFDNTMKVMLTEYDAGGIVDDERLFFWIDPSVGIVKGQEVESGVTIELIAYSPSSASPSLAGTVATSTAGHGYRARSFGISAFRNRFATFHH